QDDHEWMQALLMEGMPSPEEILQRVKEQAKSGTQRREKTVPKGVEGGGPGSGHDRSGPSGGGPSSSSASSRAAHRLAQQEREREERRRAKDKKGGPPALPSPAADDDAPSPLGDDDDLAFDTALPDDPPEDDGGSPDPFKGLKGAALRRAQRQKEIEEERKR